MKHELEIFETKRNIRSKANSASGQTSKVSMYYLYYFEIIHI